MFGYVLPGTRKVDGANNKPQYEESKANLENRREVRPFALPRRWPRRFFRRRLGAAIVGWHCSLRFASRRSRSTPTVDPDTMLLHRRCLRPRGRVGAFGGGPPTPSSPPPFPT